MILVRITSEIKVPGPAQGSEVRKRNKSIKSGQGETKMSFLQIT